MEQEWKYGNWEGRYRMGKIRKRQIYYMYKKDVLIFSRMIKLS